MIEELKVIISAETSKFKKATEDAQKEVLSFSEQVEKAGEEVDSKFAAMGESIKTGMKVGAAAIAATGAALLALGASTAEYRNEQAKLVTAFETAGSSAEQATTTYNDLYRVLGDGGVATEAAAHLAKLTTDQKSLSEWTNICQGVYATFGDSLPIESLTEAANETAKTGSLTGALADALNWAGISEDAFQASLEACNTEAEREQLIRGTLNGLYDDASKKFEKNNASVIAQNEAQAKLDATMAKLGETVAPILTLFTDLANKALSALAPYLESFAENVLPVIADVLETIAGWLGDVFNWALKHKEILIAIGAAIGIVVTAIGLYNAVTAIKAAMDAAQVTSIGALISAHIAQAAAAMVALAPYLLIVAAIAAVIAIIVLCIKYWDEIVAAVKKAWDKMKEILSKVGSWIDKNLVQPVIGFFKGLWDGIKNIFSSVGSWFGNIFKTAVNGIKNAFSSVVNFFSGIWEKIKSIFSKVGKVIGDAISGAVKTAINFVLSTAVKIINGFISAINLAISVINAIPGVEIDKIKKLDVPKLAKGGVIDSATLAVVGEQGKEAVVPLENNLGWLNKLAGMLADRMGTDTPIVLQVDGKTFAQTAFSTMNKHTRQTGKFDLVIV